jgi:hypothetical protein
MIKCTDKGVFTCRTRDNKPKKEFDTDADAITFAKWANKKFGDGKTKQVAYKCTNCHKYHLLTVKIKNR